MLWDAAGFKSSLAAGHYKHGKCRWYPAAMVEMNRPVVALLVSWTWSHEQRIQESLSAPGRGCGGALCDKTWWRPGVRTLRLPSVGPSRLGTSSWDSRRRDGCSHITSKQPDLTNCIMEQGLATVALASEKRKFYHKVHQQGDRREGQIHLPNYVFGQTLWIREGWVGMRKHWQVRFWLGGF